MSELQTLLQRWFVLILRPVSSICSPNALNVSCCNFNMFRVFWDLPLDLLLSLICAHLHKWFNLYGALLVSSRCFEISQSSRQSIFLAFNLISSMFTTEFEYFAVAFLNMVCYLCCPLLCFPQHGMFWNFMVNFCQFFSFCLKMICPNSRQHHEALMYSSEL